MNLVMDVINFLMDAGSSVFMPIIIFTLSLIFGQKIGKAFKSGIVVGIGFIGINLVIGLLSDNLAIVIDNLVNIYNFKLTSIDMGWMVGATIAWGGGAVVPVTIIGLFLTNVLLVTIRFTKTIDVDIWNYWTSLFLSSSIYLISGNMVIAVAASCFVFAIYLKIADYGQPYFKKMFGIEGITIMNFETMAWAPVGIFLNKLIDKIPFINKIDWTPESIQKRFGVFGEPYFIGLVIGIILAVIARMDIKDVLNIGIITSAAMFLLPRMISVLMEGLMPVSESAKEFMTKRFEGRQINIGLDAAVVVGHPSVIATQLLLIPTSLILALIVPGNNTLPLAELSGICFLIVWAVMPSNGNVFRGWLIGSVIMTFTLLLATSWSPVMTQLAANTGFIIPEGTSLITCLTIGGAWISWVVFQIVSKFII